MNGQGAQIRKYISLQEAAKKSSYSQEYLSLRARQGKIKAVKVGRNWVTTEKWLKEYIGLNQNDVIKVVKAVKKEIKKEKIIDFSFIKEINLPTIHFPEIKSVKRIINFLHSLENSVGWSMDRGLTWIDKFIFRLKRLSQQAKKSYFIRRVSLFRENLRIGAIQKVKLLRWEVKWQLFVKRIRQRFDNLSDNLNAYFSYSIEAVNLRSVLTGCLIVLLLIELFSYFSPRLEAGLAFGKASIKRTGREIISQASVFVIGLVSSGFDMAGQTPQKLVNYYQSADKKNEELKQLMTQIITDLPDGIGLFLIDSEKTIISLSQQAPDLIELFVSYSYSFVKTTVETASDTLSDTADEAKNSAFILISKIEKQSANLAENITHLPQKISSKVNLFVQRGKNKLGEAYLKLVQFFNPSYQNDDSLVYAPKDDFKESVDSLEQGIINDIQQRFGDFRGDWHVEQAKETEEGVVVIPLEGEEETAKQKIEELSLSFSDEVKIERDETGKAGIIKPIFGQEEAKKYLYMMVPVKEGGKNE